MRAAHERAFEAPDVQEIDTYHRAMFTATLTRKSIGMAKEKKRDAPKITTQPRGNGELEKGEKEKSEKKLDRVLGK